MKIQDIVFRSWYYLQLGWQVYFSIVFAFVNMITILYAFVINDSIILQDLFPTYLIFAIFISILIPTISIIFGYKHFKSGARRAEVDILHEVNPYFTRRTVNSQLMLQTYLILNKLILKKNNSEKLTENEYTSLSNEIGIIKNLLESRNMSNKMDLSYIKKESQGG
jgi:hypothetical protein